MQQKSLTRRFLVILEAMRKTDGDGCSMFEAHADLEIVRIRLGKALDYEYHEDYIGGYFSERGPRDTTALLDIERAFNKLEKVALRYRKEKNKPLVLVINQCHLIRDDNDGKGLLELLQQRAEQVCVHASKIPHIAPFARAEPLEQIFILAWYSTALISCPRFWGLEMQALFSTLTQAKAAHVLILLYSGLLPTSSL